MTASPTGSEVHPDCVAAVRAAATLCESLGHQVEEATLDRRRRRLHDPLRQPVGLRQRLGHRGLGGAARARRSTEGDVEPLSWALIELGRSLNGGAVPHVGAGAADDQPPDRRRTSRGSTSCSPPRWASRRHRSGTFDSPPGEPLTGLFRAAAYVPFTPPFNVTGQPGISLPLHWNDGGLPIGVQFVGRFGDEETLLVAGRPARAGGPVGGAPAAGRGVGGTGAVGSPGHSACPSRWWACTCCSGCTATWSRCPPACGWAGRARAAGRGPWRRRRSPRRAPSRWSPAP